MGEIESPQFASANDGSTYLVAANDIARQLVRDAKPNAAGFGWDGDDLIGADEAGSQIIHGPVGTDLYAGTAGIAWFLAQIAQRDPSAVPYALTAEGAIRAALADAVDYVQTRRVALFNGATGIALAAVEVGDCLERAALAQAGIDLARQIAASIRKESGALETDYIGGLAGIVTGLLAIHRRSASKLIVEACRVACEQLIERARREAWGWCWPEPSMHERVPGLCGLAHGASGIGLALAECGSQINEPKFMAAAHEAFRYERSWLSPERCAWPDLREGTEETLANGQWPGWTTAWCHGGLGIGLARLRWYELTHATLALAEASVAIQGARALVVQSGLGLREGNHADVSMCHGLSGVIELFIVAAEVLGQSDHLRAAQRVGNLCLQIYRANNSRWTYGLRGARAVPGLFLGLAGIGLTMLRLHDAKLFNSPDLLRRPPGRARTKKYSARRPLQHSVRL